ncbi:hypothetical protein RDABS01_035298 [Bienertia sinuspersici]
MITKVLDQKCGWKYSSCNICKSKLDNSQYCNKCNITPQFPLNRYRVVVTLYDEETTINVGIFNKDVEKIVKYQPQHKTYIKSYIINMQHSPKDDGPTRVSKELQQCIGKNAP